MRPLQITAASATDALTHVLMAAFAINALKDGKWLRATPDGIYFISYLLDVYWGGRHEDVAPGSRDSCRGLRD